MVRLRDVVVFLDTVNRGRYAATVRTRATRDAASRLLGKYYPRRLGDRASRRIIPLGCQRGGTAVSELAVER